MIRNALFLCVVCALVFVFYLPSYVKMQDLHERNRVQEKRIKELERDNVHLEEERRRLTDDPVYFEKIAREKMGIIKDGEVIYKIVGPGQKKDGVVSEEASIIIKKAEDDAPDDKPKAKAAVKPAAKTATVVKKSTTKKTTATKAKSTKKPALKKDTKTKAVKSKTPTVNKSTQ